MDDPPNGTNVGPGTGLPFPPIHSCRLSSLSWWSLDKITDYCCRWERLHHLVACRVPKHSCFFHALPLMGIEHSWAFGLLNWDTVCHSWAFPVMADCCCRQWAWGYWAFLLLGCWWPGHHMPHTDSQAYHRHNRKQTHSQTEVHRPFPLTPGTDKTCKPTVPPVRPSHAALGLTGIHIDWEVLESPQDLCSRP
jgi:hypothetical protein